LPNIFWSVFDIKLEKSKFFLNKFYESHSRKNI
jgi:hypothetical protein